MPRKGSSVLLLSVLVAFTAQQVLMPVLAPLSRSVGLSELDLGWVMTVAAIMFVVTSLAWGRVLDRWGHRRVMLTGMTVALAGVVGFALVAQSALAGALSPGVTLAGMIATRSVLFGIGLGAIPVAAMSLVAASTGPGPERTAGIGRLGAAQGVAVALGPALGGLLGFAGLLGPVWVAPVMLALALVAVALGLPRRVPRAAADPDPGTTAGPALRPWDARLWPILLVGFLSFVSLGLVLIVLGFLIQDRLGLDPAGTVRAAGLVSFGSGVVLVAVQGALVPWLRWSPVRLLRVGLPVSAVALGGLALAQDLIGITAAVVGLALGLGLVMPGYTTAPTLLVGPSEQGSVAGLVNAVNGSTFVVGPLVGTALYSVSDALPALVGAGACVLGLLLALANPAWRRIGEAAAPTPAVAATGGTGGAGIDTGRRESTAGDPS